MWVKGKGGGGSTPSTVLYTRHIETTNWSLGLTVDGEGVPVFQDLASAIIQNIDPATTKSRVTCTGSIQFQNPSDTPITLVMRVVAIKESDSSEVVVGECAASFPGWATYQALPLIVDRIVDRVVGELFTIQVRFGLQSNYAGTPDPQSFGQSDSYWGETLSLIVSDVETPIVSDVEAA